MEFLIVSGLSGGGKSRAADVLEDLDFYCVDNMPTALLTKFAELCLATRGRYEKVALVTDIRSQESFTELFAALDELADMGVDYRILFVEASESAIVRRYKESRRPHPLQAESRCSLPEAVRRESELLAPVRERADYVINTTGLTLSMLQKRICEIFVDGGIRTGTDVFKALALGADAVLIGRPFVPMVYGDGAQGVATYIEKIGSELRDTMAMCGVHTLGEITRDCVRVL